MSGNLLNLSYLILTRYHPLIKCNVALSGLNATDDPAPGIAFARSLRESGEWQGQIFGLAYDATETGIYQDAFFDRVFMMPDPLLPELFFNRLQQICVNSNIHVLIPSLDYELIGLSSLTKYFKGIGINTLIPSAPALRNHLKTKLPDFCSINGFKSPQQMSIVHPDSIYSVVAELGLPVVVKGVIHGSHIAYSINEAIIYFHKIRQRWGAPVLLQEYIPGEEYNTDCLVDRDRKVIGAVQMKKLALTDKGKGWSGVTLYDKSLMDLCFAIIDKLRWVGPIELEFVKHGRSGDYYLLEINPRFGTWIYLSAKAGQNLPLAAVRLALGERLKPLPMYQTGKMFVRYSLDKVCPLSQLAEIMTTGELDLSGKSYKGIN